MEPLIYWVWLTTLKGLNDACRHRLLAQKQRQAAVLDFMLRGVDFAVPRNDAAG